MPTQLFSSFKTLSLIVLAALAAGSSSQALAQSAERKLGDVVISANLKNMPIAVSATTPELQTLARTAFSAHGAFRLQP